LEEVDEVQSLVAEEEMEALGDEFLL